jgi:hypothetical protein
MHITNTHTHGLPGRRRGRRRRGRRGFILVNHTPASVCVCVCAEVRVDVDGRWEYLFFSHGLCIRINNRDILHTLTHTYSHSHTHTCWSFPRRERGCLTAPLFARNIMATNATTKSRDTRLDEPPPNSPVSGVYTYIHTNPHIFIEN